MSNELNDKNLPGKNPDHDKLLDYLNRTMPDEEQHDFEKNMSEDEFMNDAVDGLESLKNKHLDLVITQLNNDLKKNLEKKKNRRNQRIIKEPSGIYFAVILIILLIIIAYVVIKQLQ